MTRADASFGVLVLVLTFAAILARCAPPVEAQGDDATMLLRICAHESTRFALADCTGIHATIVNDARGLSFAASARLHSRRFFGGAPGEMNAWTAQLDMTCARPRAFYLATGGAMAACVRCWWRRL